MKRSVWLVLLPAALLLGGAASGQETYQLRMRPRGIGESTLDLSTRVRLSVVKWDPTGQQIADELKVVKSRIACTTQTLEVKGDKALRERRHYTKASSSIDGGDEQAEAYEGKTLLFLAKESGGHTVLTEKGEPLPPALVAELEKRSSQFNSPMTKFEDMLPRNPVHVGDSWTIDAASWIKRGDIELQVTKANSKLMKVYKKQGRLFGVIEARVEMAMKAMTVAGRKMVMQPGSRITVRSMMEGCLDGSATECVESGTYLFTATVRAAGPDGLDTKMDQEIEVSHVQTTK